MTMASLSAALISRNNRREVERTSGEVVLLPPKPKPTAAAKPVRVTPVKARPRPKAETAGKPARQRKTLRLMRETHRALRALAEEKGVSQQSLMETAVETLLREEKAGPARH